MFADVAAVRGDDERRARGERGGEAARDEEVRVDDVGLGSAGRGARPGGERRGSGACRRRACRGRRARSCARAPRAPARDRGRRPRGPARRGPGTSARRGGCAPAADVALSAHFRCRHVTDSGLGSRPGGGSRGAPAETESARAAGSAALRVVHAPLLAQHVADLADRAAGAERLAHRREQVRRRPPRRAAPRRARPPRPRRPAPPARGPSARAGGARPPGRAGAARSCSSSASA